MDIRIWHVPQVPGKAFHVVIESIEEGKRLLDILALYDEFQFENNIKPDYSNASGIEYWDVDAAEWLEVDEEFADDSA